MEITISEAILTLNANVIVACERAGFDSATVRMIEDALDIIEDALKAQEPVGPVVDIDTWKCGNCGHVLEHQELLGDNVLFHEQYNYCPNCGRAVKWDMTDKEKVIKALECCEHISGDYCRLCPYHEDIMADTPPCCTGALAHDALALLKSQEPRVLTPEELYLQETVWFEEKPNHTMKQLTQDGIAALVFIGLLHNWSGYGTVWRCWTSRPTDEQRKAVKWE